MKKIVGLAVALLSLFSISSCIEKNAFLGSAMVPSDQDILIKTATFDLPVDLRMADSLQSSISQSITVGSIRTDTFGLFSAEAAMDLTAATDSIDWGRNPSVRKIAVTLARDTAIVHDAAQRHIPQNLHLYYLKTQLDSTHRYNNSLGAADHEWEELMAASVPYVGEDSYTFELKEEIGERLFRIPMSVLDSADLMMKEFHGFYMTCDVPEGDMEAGRLNVFDLSSSSLALTYDYDDSLGVRKSATAYFQLGSHYTLNVTTSGAGNLVTDNPGETIYMEGLSGIKPHIDARKLRSQMAGWASLNGVDLERLVVAKATIEFPFEYDGDYTRFDYWSGDLYPCQRTVSGDYINYGPIQEISDTALENGSMDRSNLWYKSNVSIYLQRLLHKAAAEVTAEDDLWMMPTVSTTNSYTGDLSYYSDCYFYPQDLLNGTGALRHPVLRLTYSVLN